MTGIVLEVYKKMYSQKFYYLMLVIVMESLFFKLGLPHEGHGTKKSFVNLILISFDGFRYDYLDLAKKHGMLTPNFDELIQRGSSSSGTDGMKNVFITKTFPNHYSMVTGFYEESHGIVANSFFDPLFNETFQSDSTGQKWWDGASGKRVEPIWITNEKCKCGRRSGVVFWPGSDVDNQRPTYLLPYNESISFKTEVNTLMGWFTEHEPINLGLMYFSEPDMTGHSFGPESKEVAEKVVELDGILGFLLTKLREEKLLETMNIIITSDHGMVDQKKTIYLDDYVDPHSFQLFGGSPAYGLLPNKDNEDEIYNKLKDVPNLIVYKKDEIPADYHYKNNRRIMTLLVTAKEGYAICKENKTGQCFTRTGDHGYNNSLESMHPIFVAAGPAFRKGFKIEKQFETVDIYSLVCFILGVEPHNNEGDFERISQVLWKQDRNLGEDLAFLGVMIVVIGVALTFCIFVCINHFEYFLKRKHSSPGEDDVLNKDGRKRLLTSEEDDELV